MARRKQQRSGFDDEVAPQQSTEAEDQEQPESGEGGRYKKLDLNPKCPRCSDERTNKVVWTKITSTQGPIVYVKCPECRFTTKVTREFVTASDAFRKQQSVAARPDMER